MSIPENARTEIARALGLNPGALHITCVRLSISSVTDSMIFAAMVVTAPRTCDPQGVFLPYNNLKE